MALVLIGYAAAVSLALLLVLSLRRERYDWLPPYFDWEWDERYRRRRDGGWLLILLVAISVFIVLALQPAQ
jgi:hypothetical protein